MTYGSLSVGQRVQLDGRTATVTLLEREPGSPWVAVRFDDGPVVDRLAAQLVN